MAAAGLAGTKASTAAGARWVTRCLARPSSCLGSAATAATADAAAVEGGIAFSPGIMSAELSLRAGCKGAPAA